MKIFINILLFQIAWFGCVLGAGKSNFWVGPLAVVAVIAVHLAMRTNLRAELMIIGAATVIGFMVDTVLTAFGVYEPARYYVPAPWSPLWLIGMWPNFATLLNVSLRWLHGRYYLATLLGAIGGALAYYSGMPLGALSFNAPVLKNVIFVGFAWGVVTPTLFWIVNIANKQMKQETGDGPTD